MIAAPRLSAVRLTAFSLGSIGTGLFSTTPAVLLLYYMTQLLGVSGALAGTALLIPKLWDMVTDPFVGVLSDRTRTPFGRRRPFLLAGALLTPLGLAALFAVPDGLGQLATFWYIVIVYTLSATAYSLFSVPYITIPAELSDDGDERTRIMSYRTAFVMLGVLVGSALPPYLVAAYGGDKAAYGAAGLTLATITAGAMLTAVFSLSGVKLLSPEPAPFSLGALARAVATPAFIWLSVTHILQITAVGVTLAAASYFAVFVFNSDTGLAGDFLAVTFLTAFFTMPVWTFACAKLGKLAAFGAGAGLYTLSALSLALFGAGWTPHMLFAVGAGMGAAFAAVQMIPYALLTDTIHKHGADKGFGQEGVFTGVWTALEKFGLAFAPFLFGVGLDLVGFIEGEGPDVQPGGTDQMILWLGGGLPAGLIALSFVGLFFFRRAMRS
ncbi:MAG: MFS transporter [Hyphomonadaceae bacterium]|nr:MFS transporter [Hyphomonadaceae bacterium]